MHSKREFSISIPPAYSISKVLGYLKGEEDHKGYEDYEGAKMKGVIPVYYSKEESAALYLSFAALDVNNGRS